MNQPCSPGTDVGCREGVADTICCDRGSQRKWKFRGLGGVGGTELCLAREVKRLHRYSIWEATNSVSEKRHWSSRRWVSCHGFFGLGREAGKVSSPVKAAAV